ncbi:MAG TPA: response regulator transcription factor [Acidimicrobiales bacterium]|nr:response regulator transcription factor [Acidimicrobiales bacterium]
MTLPQAEPSSRSRSPFADVPVLLVEDDEVLAQVVAGALRGRGYPVEIVGTGGEALARASATEPKVVVLDLGLPDIDGIDVCRRLRRWFEEPIVVLSADGDEDRKVTALDDGADDYVTKPFSMAELMARLRVAVRHRQAQLSPAADGVRLGDLHVDVTGHRAAVAGEPLRLTRKEFGLLSLLARGHGRVLTHRALLDAVWGSPDLAQTASLRVHITQLRNKLGRGPYRPRLVSEPGVGYRLVTPDPPEAPDRDR